MPLPTKRLHRHRKPQFPESDLTCASMALSRLKSPANSYIPEGADESAMLLFAHLGLTLATARFISKADLAFLARGSMLLLT